MRQIVLGLIGILAIVACSRVGEEIKPVVSTWMVDTSLGEHHAVYIYTEKAPVVGADSAKAIQVLLRENLGMLDVVTSFAVKDSVVGDSTVSLRGEVTDVKVIARWWKAKDGEALSQEKVLTLPDSVTTLRTLVDWAYPVIRDLSRQEE